jgi:hypothetical protein
VTLPDINTPTRDRSLEPLRQAVVQAIADVEARAETFYAAVNALNTRTDAAQIAAETAVQNCDLLQTQMADVLARLAALENP